MKKSGHRNRSIQMIVAFIVAVQNLRLYADLRASTSLSIDKAYNSVLNVLLHSDPLDITRTRGNIQISDEFIGEYEQAKCRIDTFTRLLMKKGIQRLTFTGGLEKEEFRYFLEDLTNNSNNRLFQEMCSDDYPVDAQRHVKVEFS